VFSHKLEQHKPYNAVLEAPIGYAGACMGARAMDEKLGYVRGWK